jgi:uncharacterized protein YuzE
MTEPNTTYSVDPSLGVSYLSFYSEEATTSIPRTISAGSINIDINQDGELVGIECLDLDAPIARWIDSVMNHDRVARRR